MKNAISERTPFSYALSYLPTSVADKIRARAASLGNCNVNEIRLRSPGACAIVVRGRSVMLDAKLGRDEMGEIFKRICSGAVFAHRDDVRQGFVTLEYGVRVGVCGRARYDGGTLVGVYDVSSLVFRIPTGRCDFAERLFAEWQKYGGGLLICSPAGVGKTTAIRSLCALIGSGTSARRVVVVDERCEFIESDYTGRHVDILRGYKRSLGIEIALRTMSAEVIAVDEISCSQDAVALESAVGAGSDVIATVHAPSLDGALKRAYLRRLVFAGVFGSVCVLSRRDAIVTYSLHPIGTDIAKTLHGEGDTWYI